MEKNYRISFRIGESSFEIESTDLKWLKSKEKECFQKLLSEAPNRRDKSEPEVVKGRVGVLPPQVTLVELYRKYKYKIKSRPSIAVLFVYYLEKMRKKDKIRTSDVGKCFKEIAYPNWNKINVTYILTGGRKRGLLNYVNNLWTLTTTGEDYILNIVTGKSK